VDDPARTPGRSFVLVPGAGGSAWVWSRVSALLAGAGQEPVPVDLPGEDEGTGLPEYVELVLAAIGDRTDVVLVAGSLGGFTAPMVAERAPAGAIGALVLVNAMIPLPGETPGAWWGNTGAIEARDAAAQAGGYGPFDEATYFLHDLAPEVVAEGEPHHRIEAERVFGSVCEFTAWPAVPIRVLAGRDDRFFPVGLQRRVARERLGLEVDVLMGGHLLPLAAPDAVTDRLLRLSRPTS
jgi:pimeloyl-ACP methyl ester carboxylesterase